VDEDLRPLDGGLLRRLGGVFIGVEDNEDMTETLSV
jgi:hypothetical protein